MRLHGAMKASGHDPINPIAVGLDWGGARLSLPADGRSAGGGQRAFEAAANNLILWRRWFKPAKVHGQVTFETKTGRGGGDLPLIVGLDAAARYQRIGLGQQLSASGRSIDFRCSPRMPHHCKHLTSRRYQRCHLRPRVRSRWRDFARHNRNAGRNFIRTIARSET